MEKVFILLLLLLFSATSLSLPLPLSQFVVCLTCQIEFGLSILISMPSHSPFLNIDDIKACRCYFIMYVCTCHFDLFLCVYNCLTFFFYPLPCVFYRAQICSVEFYNDTQCHICWRFVRVIEQIQLMVIGCVFCLAFVVMSKFYSTAKS